MIILVFLVMVEVVLVLGPPTSTPIKLVLADTCMMWGLGHIIVISQDPPYRHHLVSMTHLMLLVVLHLVLQMVMIKVVRITGASILPLKKWIVGLIVVVLCHLWVGIIQAQDIETNTGFLLNYI